MYKGTVGGVIQVIETTLTKMAADVDQRVAEDNVMRRESGRETKNLVDRAEHATLQLRDFMKQAQITSLKTAEKVTKYAMIPSFLLALGIFLISILPVLIARI